MRIAEQSDSSTIDSSTSGPSTPAPPNYAVDVEVFPPSSTATTTTASSFSNNFEGGSQSLIVEPDVTTVEGLVALTIDCLREGLSDEATIFQRHIKSPDFGNPLLRIASPSSDLTEFPHIPGEREVSLFGWSCDGMGSDAGLAGLSAVSVRPSFLFSCYM